VVSSPLCVINQGATDAIASARCRTERSWRCPDRRSRPHARRAHNYVCSPLVVLGARRRRAGSLLSADRDLLRTPGDDVLCAGTRGAYSPRGRAVLRPDHVVLCTHAGRHYAAPAAAYVAPVSYSFTTAGRDAGLRVLDELLRRPGLFRPRVYSRRLLRPGRNPAYSGRAYYTPLYYRY